MNWRHTVKRGISRGLSGIGRSGLLDSRVPWLMEHIVPRLCYPGVLSREPRPRRLRGTSAKVLCDPHNPFHCMPYWFGVLFERQLDVFLRRVSRPGDAVIDVGANYGHITMLSAALVYPGGTVHAFEPHPGLAKLLERHAATSQRVGRVQVWQKALSDHAGTMTLRVNPGWLGGSTLRPDPNRDSRTGIFVQEIEVEVARGDDLSLELPGDARLIIKIDVEGHEPAVIRGMSKLLARAQGVVVEVTPVWLGGAAGVAALLDEMRGRGFEAWELDSLLAPRPRRCQRVEVQEREQTNVLFARPSLEPAFNC